MLLHMARLVKNPLARESGSDDGRATRWDQHRTDRRAELVEAAVAAIDTHGPAASIAQIAESRASASRCSTATSRTRTTSTVPSAGGAPSR